MAARFRETATALKVVVIAVGVLQHLDPGKISFKFYLIIYDQYDQYDEAIAIMIPVKFVYTIFSQKYINTQKMYLKIYWSLITNEGVYDRKDLITMLEISNLWIIYKSLRLWLIENKNKKSSGNVIFSFSALWAFPKKTYYLIVIF